MPLRTADAAERQARGGDRRRACRSRGAGELAARGYAVTVYDEREEIGGLVRYAIAPVPPVERAAAGRGAAARASSASSSALRSRVDAARLRELEAEFDAIVLAVGMGADVDVSYEGDELEGVWESLPFIERLKTGEPAHVGKRVAVIGGGNTAVDVAVEAQRLGAATSRSCSTGAPRTRCPRTSTRSSWHATRASRSGS